MKIVDKMPKARHYIAHDWDLLFDGQCRELTHDVDYKCTTSAMSAQIFRNAKKRGINVKVSQSNGLLYVQAESKRTDSKQKK